MDEAFSVRFLNGYSGDSRFPHDFLEDYEALQCFSHNEMGETLLVKERKTGTYCVAKCYTAETFLSHTTESDLLKQLCHRGLPSFLGEYQNNGMLCVVREYVKGTPLDQYAAENEFSREQVILIGIQLCDILAYLHGQKPPVIHRDIKPQNIIVDARGKIKLIDFGISRIYNEAAQEDTVCMGTKHFAAPEQYGFLQTDSRADIFSLGVLLGWLLTGESDVKIALSKIENKRLRQIINKCSAFSPEQRYSTAAKVKAALLRADGSQQKSTLRWGCGTLVCTALLCIGFAIGRYTEYTPAFMTGPGVQFEEPLIEQAVRLALDKQERDPITEEDLLRVTELFIYGNQAAGSLEQFEVIGVHMVQNDYTVHNGGISSLNDLAALKNLRRVNIAWQNIGNLSPLENISGLEQVQLKHNPIEDVSPLASLLFLRDLCLYDTRVSDLSSLADCPMLENINVGKTHIASLSAFSGIRSLKYLYADQILLDTLDGIGEFSRLEQIGLGYVADGDLSPLLSLPQLREAHLDGALRDAAAETLSQAQFKIIYP